MKVKIMEEEVEHTIPLSLLMSDEGPSPLWIQHIPKRKA